MKDSISMLASMKNKITIKTKKPSIKKKADLQSQITPHYSTTSIINSNPRKITFLDEENERKSMCINSEMDIHSSRVEHETGISHVKFKPPPLTVKNET